MKKITPWLAILFAGFLSGCLTQSPGMDRLWFFIYHDGQTSGIDAALTPASFLELKPDQSFTRDFGRFEYGHWEISGEQLILINQFDEKIRFGIKNGKDGEMQLHNGSSGASHFDGQELPAPQNDPFSLGNNRWRLKAKGREPDTQLRDRLRNHCSFWEAYFDWAMTSEISTVDVRSTPTPIKIYGNGFSIKPYADLPEAWKFYFYDSVDCRRCNDILMETVKKNTVAWAHTDNKYKMFLSAFQQLEKFLR